MTTIRIKHIFSLSELDTIEKAWTDLERADEGPSIFQSWIWNRTWCEYQLSDGRKARLDVRVVEDGAGRTLAILPFFKEAIGGPFADLSQFLGHRMSFHNDVLLFDPRNLELTDKIIYALINDLGVKTVLHLRHLSSESLFTKQLLAHNLAEYQCPRLWLCADPNINDQRIRLGRSTRKRLRTKENKLRREFGSEFRVRIGEDFPKAFDEFIDLHQRRFSSMKRSTLLVGQNLEFLKSVASTLSNSGNFEIVQLRAGEATIAAALMVHFKERYFFVNAGLEPEFARFSPMRLLLIESMRRCFDELSCEIFDLGPGYEAYKYDWKPSIGSNYFCCLGGTGPYAKALASFYRVGFRRRVKAAASPALTTLHK